MERIQADSPHLKEDIRRTYDTFAPRYDLSEGFLEWLGVGRLRRNLLATAGGRVLEVAVGTGRNLPYYPAACELTAVDLSEGMLQQARRRAQRLGRAVDFRTMDAEALDFGDGSFDTVVLTLSLCTFPEPVAALREMARVVRPAGRVLLIEHGRSDRRWLAAFQDRRAESHFAALGCWWNREPPQLAEEAGLVAEQASRHLLGVFHRLALRRGAAAGPATFPGSPRENGAIRANDDTFFKVQDHD